MTLGILMLILSVPLLWLNERKVVKLDKLIGQANEEMQDIDNVDEPKEAQNGKLVYASGVSLNSRPIKDEALGLCVINSAKLERKVEMYQWKPYVNGKNSIGQDLMLYRKVWSTVAIPSGANPIGYLNPADIPIKSEVFHGTEVKLGKFDVTKDIINQLETANYFTPQGDEEENCLEKLSAIAKKRFYTKPRIEGNYIIMKKRETEGFQVGDIRISFVETKCGPLSIIGRQRQRDEDGEFELK